MKSTACSIHMRNTPRLWESCRALTQTSIQHNYLVLRRFILTKTPMTTTYCNLPIFFRLTIAIFCVKASQISQEDRPHGLGSLTTTLTTQYTVFFRAFILRYENLQPWEVFHFLLRHARLMPGGTILGSESSTVRYADNSIVVEGNVTRSRRIRAYV